MNRPANITYIDDLPELTELAEYSEPIVDPQQDRYKKYIRNNTVLTPESGMMLSKSDYPMSHPPSPPSKGASNKEREDEEKLMGMYAAQHFYGAPTCIDVANHIRMCPICSKLYNTDYTMYMLCIIILAIVCIILMKKCLNL